MTRELKEESEGRSMYVPKLRVLVAESLRSLIDKVNGINEAAQSQKEKGNAIKIERESIVSVTKQDGTYMLLYFA